jgi:ribosomal protein S18 acetylase RimI-like enzyme
MYHSPLDDPDPAVFRQATFNDMSDIWRLVYHAYSTYIPLLGRTPPTFTEDFDRHVALGNLWIVQHVDGVHAMVVLTPMLDHLLIQALCVDPAHQGRGLGRMLLSFSEQRAQQLGTPELRLYTNSVMARNIKIYRKWGFKQTHLELYDWGTKVHMRKILRKPVLFAKRLRASSREPA